MIWQLDNGVPATFAPLKPADLISTIACSALAVFGPRFRILVTAIAVPDLVPAFAVPDSTRSASRSTNGKFTTALASVPLSLGTAGCPTIAVNTAAIDPDGYVVLDLEVAGAGNIPANLFLGRLSYTLSPTG